MICGHPPPLRLTADGGLQALTPRSYATPLGLHPDIQPSTFTVSAGDRMLFYIDGLLEAHDQEGRYFRLEDCAGLLRQPELRKVHHPARTAAESRHVAKPKLVDDK